MNQLRIIDITQQLLYATTGLANDLFCIGGIVVHQTTRNLFAARIKTHHKITAIKFTFNAAYTNR